MPLEGLKKTLERKSSKREQDENRICLELGQEYLDFALKFEKEMKAIPQVYLEDISNYPEGITNKKELIWFRACTQAYNNYFRDEFHEKLYGLSSPVEKISSSVNFIPLIEKNVIVAREIFTDEELKYFISEIREIVKDTVRGKDLNDKKEKILVGEIIRDSLDNLVGEIGADRFKRGALKK